MPFHSIMETKMKNLITTKHLGAGLNALLFSSALSTAAHAATFNGPNPQNFIYSSASNVCTVFLENGTTGRGMLDDTGLGADQVQITIRAQSGRSLADVETEQLALTRDEILLCQVG